MCSRVPAISVPTKDVGRQNVEAKVGVPALALAISSGKSSGPGIKITMNKSTPKDQPKEMSPPAEGSELLGSLTTQQQQRTSARVIKKLKLEPLGDKKKRSKDQPKDMSPQAEGSELLGSLTTQQQRTSARVMKKLKLKPLGDKKKRSDGASDEIPECDTPSKISEELKFPVKQRMPKALWSTDEKNLFFEALNEYGKDFDAITAYICAKMKKKGMPDVNLKTKTQVSHFYYRTWHKLSKHVHFDENVKKVAQELYALINYGELRKKLVSVNEKTCGRLGEMVLGGSIVVRARGRNLRVRTPMCRALRRLNQITERACGSRVCARATVAMRARDAGAWARVQAAAHNPRLAVSVPPTASLKAFIGALANRWQSNSGLKQEPFDEGSTHHSDHLYLESDRHITKDGKALHVGPRLGAEVHLPVIRPSAQLSSQKICFSSYLQRMAPRGDVAPKIRTPKRQRKDSTTDKDKEVDQKKARLEEDSKLINIEETAIDGIELMASYKHNQEDERPSTEDEKDVKEEDLRGAVDEDIEKDDKEDVLKDREETVRIEDGARERDMSEREKDSFSEMEDDEKYAKSDTDNESDHGKGKDRKFNNLKVKFRIRPKKRGGSIYTLVMDSDKEEREDKPDIDVELALKQIRAGWSVKDAGELTLGDLYLMFGSRSRLELDYWWAEPSPPLPQKPRVELSIKTEKTEKVEKTDKAEKSEKTEKTPDKGTDSSVEDDKGARESDTDIFSPKNTFSQDSNDGSGDERKDVNPGEQPWSPEHKATNSTLKLVSKLVNRPRPLQLAPDNGFSAISERLKRLLSLAGNPHVSSKARCLCGHECSRRGRPPPPPAPVFRPPAPIAPRPDHESAPPLELGDVPRVRRGRARGTERRVVVQRLLPLLPALAPHTLLPVKLVPNSPPAPPRILPKPPPTTTSDLSFFYVLSESNGQFYFHDGDRRIPITQPDQETVKDEISEQEDMKPESSDGTESEICKDLGLASETSKEQSLKSEVSKISGIKTEATKDPHISGGSAKKIKGEPPSEGERKEGRDVGSFLCQESMSLSPSRLLREAEGWMEGGVQDFSLSSFLAHLESRAPQDTAVDSHLHSLLAESSVDYVAKFADLAAEVTDEVDPLANEDLS